MQAGLAPMEARISSKDRIIDAVLQLWEEVGSARMSVRMLAEAAGITVSSIYHHFGSLEQLFALAQEHARACAAAWCDEQLRDLRDVRLDRTAFAPLFAALIDDWAHGQRRLAFAWREGQQLARHDPFFQPGAARWDAFWIDFWAQVGRHCGLEERALLTARLFYSESFLHMIRWRRPVDRVGLDELARGWTAWLNGDPAPAAPMRDFARAEAERRMPVLPDRDDTASRIAEAAAAIVSQKGVAAMTHRAVAAQAGLTLGIVSHKFRTSAELMSAAFEALYSKLSPADPVEANGDDCPWSPEKMIETMRRSATNFGPDELIMVVARDPSFGHFAPQLRYLRGRSGGRHLQAILGPARPISALDAALFAGFSLGGLHAHLAAPEEDFGARIRQELRQLLDVIAPLGIAISL